MKALDQAISRILSDQIADPQELSTLDDKFTQWWKDLDPEDQDQYSEILTNRAAQILPNRTTVLECLPWNLIPTEEEIANLLSKWYPVGTDVSFIRECIRWAVISRPTPLDDKVVRGSRTRTIVDFAEMMANKHNRGISDHEEIKEELRKMASEGCFTSLSHGLYLPNLLGVEVNEENCLVVSGWPFMILKSLYQDLENTDSGLYTIASDKWQHDKVTSTAFTMGKDPVKTMCTSAPQYIEARFNITRSNSLSSSYPDTRNLINPHASHKFPGDLSGANLSAVAWRFKDQMFFIEDENRSSGSYEPPKMWICEEDVAQIRSPNKAQWKYSPIKPSEVKQIRIAHANYLGTPYSLSQVVNDKSINSIEIYRFSVLDKTFGIGAKEKEEFCEKNWLRLD